MTFTTRRFGAADWQEYREIRLRMLADTPIAYGETLEHARSLGDADWIMKATRNEVEPNIGLAAIDDEGAWLGVMSGFVSAHAGAMLVGVFVDPAARGRHEGVADELLDGIVDWARVFGSTLTLDVHADNPRAIGFYRRRGFVDTGVTMDYELPPFGIENQMRLAL
ncbi:MAG: GNAT family N-acetyltransferase [Microbacterium gubbeenense]|uniref:GNAT family N-acetyltransferase n=1 Tax=Microbacterium gubbeenense TaxID=159896 RepID=UPI003F95D1AE